MNRPDLVQITAVCHNLPAVFLPYTLLRLGVQNGKVGTQWQQLGQSNLLRFELIFRLKTRRGLDAPNFLGPFAQGRPADRFFYLNWQGLSEGAWHSFRRAKIKLTPLTWEQLASGVLTVRINCTDVRGGPIAATVPDTHLQWGDHE